MEEKAPSSVLHRYTSLISLLHILQNKKITLLNPESWEDRNDSAFISNYKKKRELNNLLALCFTPKTETFHHWKVFTRGSEGVRITFKKKELLDSFKDIEGIKYNSVIYKKIKEMRNETLQCNSLPFIKRHPYKDEKEFRIIYESNTDNSKIKEFDIPLKCIKRIVLNPWLSPSLAGVVKTIIKRIEGCNGIKVYQTTLLENSKWIKFGEDSLLDLPPQSAIL